MYKYANMWADADTKPTFWLRAGHPGHLVCYGINLGWPSEGQQDHHLGAEEAPQVRPVGSEARASTHRESLLVGRKKTLKERR